MKINALYLEGNSQITTVDTTSKAEMTKASTTTITPILTTTKVSTTIPFSMKTKVSTTTTTKVSTKTSTKISATTATKISTTTTTPSLMTTIINTIKDKTTHTTYGTTLTNTANKKQQIKDKNQFYLIGTLSVAGIVLVIVIIGVIIYKRKRRSVEKHYIKGKTQTDSNLYSVSNLNTNGGSGETRTINPYSGVDIVINNTNEYEIEDYDYIHSKRNCETKTTDNEGLYDHTGITLSEDYDRVVLTQKSRDKDDTYDHTGPDMNQGYSTLNTFSKVKTGSKKENYKGMINDNTYDHTVPDMRQGNRIS